MTSSVNSSVKEEKELFDKKKSSLKSFSTDNARRFNEISPDFPAPSPYFDKWTETNPEHFSIDYGEQSILSDIEKKDDNFEDSHPNRSRTSTVTQEMGISRLRRKSSAFFDFKGFDAKEKSSYYTGFINILSLLLPKLTRRCNWYLIILIFLILMIITGNYQNPVNWMIFLGAIITFDILALIVEELIFFTIDKLFSKRYNWAYLLHGFNGPVNLLIDVYLFQYYYGFFPVSRQVKNWVLLWRIFNTIIICLCVKNWIVRSHYIELLEKRYTDKLFKIETWTIVLSELASYKVTREKEGTKPFDIENSVRDGLFSSISISANAFQAVNVVQSKVMNVFVDLVESTHKYSDEFEEDVDMINILRFSGGNDPQIKDKGNGNIERVKLRRRKTFWEVAARISSEAGTLKIATLNGPVFIRKKGQAKSFAQDLYTHISRGGRRRITHKILSDIFQSKEGTESFDEEVQIISENTDTNQYLYQSAIELFDPFHLEEISEEHFIAALCLVYKEVRFAAASLNDYGELHHSLTRVIEFIFWIIMAIVLQTFLDLNIYNYMLPLLTVMIMFSFAFSSTIGNYILALSFVYFMIPFDIGQKVIIGLDPTTQIQGFIRGINLVYTTVSTLQNQLVKIPNHLLFSQYIYNLTDSGGCWFEILVSFNLFGHENSNQDKIDEFFHKVKHRILEEGKKDWQFLLITCLSINTKDNSMNYAMWFVHRDSWHDPIKAFEDRTQIVRFMKTLLIEMGLEYTKVSEPVKLSYAGGTSERN